MGKLGIVLLNALGNVVIAIGWSVTKIQIGVEWTVNAYYIGRDIARGVYVDEGP